MRQSLLDGLPARLPRLERQAVDRPPEQRLLVSYALTMVSLCLLVFLLALVVISPLQHYTAQHRLYGEFRQSLAEGSVPIGQTDVTGELTKPGTPVAELTIPSLGVDEIVVEGTTSSQTMDAVGHRRDTPLPGQAGASVLMGRRAAFGGVFSHLSDLTAGTEFTVLTGQGRATYKSLGVRTAKTMLPVPTADSGRITLTTAAGPAYRPNGATRVDAVLVSKPFPSPTSVIGPGAIPDSEQVLKGDRSHAFALSWMLELLGLLIVAGIWAWKRWEPLATWLVFLPVVGTVALAAADSVVTMLPNVL